MEVKPNEKALIFDLEDYMKLMHVTRCHGFPSPVDWIKAAVRADTAFIAERYRSNEGKSEAKHE